MRYYKKPLNLLSFYLFGKNIWLRFLPKLFLFHFESRDDYKCFTCCFYFLGFTYWFFRAI